MQEAEDEQGLAHVAGHVTFLRDIWRPFITLHAFLSLKALHVAMQVPWRRRRMSRGWRTWWSTLLYRVMSLPCLLLKASTINKPASGYAGSVEEAEDEQGLAHVVEHVTFLGSKKREGLLGTGARSNAYTDFHHTVFHVHAPLHNVSTGQPMLPEVRRLAVTAVSACMSVVQRWCKLYSAQPGVTACLSLQSAS